MILDSENLDSKREHPKQSFPWSKPSQSSPDSRSGDIAPAFNERNAKEFLATFNSPCMVPNKPSYLSGLTQQRLVSHSYHSMGYTIGVLFSSSSDSDPSFFYPASPSSQSSLIPTAPMGQRLGVRRVGERCMLLNCFGAEVTSSSALIPIGEITSTRNVGKCSLPTFPGREKWV